jgi:hypothetical protein
VKSLGDQAFVLGIDCSFFVSAQKFSGYKEDDIHFINYEHQILVFYLKDHNIHELVFSPYHFLINLPTLTLS